jgi:hypothetical protein
MIILKPLGNAIDALLTTLDEIVDRVTKYIEL